MGTRLALTYGEVILTMASVPTAALAFITTIHVAMAVLRAHRTPTSGAFGFVTAVSFLFTASPWLMPTVLGVLVGVTTHLAWFIACEQLLPSASAASTSSSAVAAASPRADNSRPPSIVRRAPTASKRPSAAPTPPAKTRDFTRVPVVAVFDETPDIRTFRMVRPDDFQFTAGQFLTIRLRADGTDHVRCYSISSPPGARGHMEISVKRLGLVSSALHATVRPGTMLSVRPPAGGFVYPVGDDRPIVLIAGGVGITPLMSMLRHGVDTEPARPITLVYSVRTQADIAFHDEIRLLDRRHDQFRSVIAITDGPVGEGFFPGKVSETLLKATVPDLLHTSCLICGQIGRTHV